MEAKESWAQHAIHDLALPDSKASSTASARKIQGAPHSLEARFDISSGLDKSTYSCFLPARDIVTPDHWVDSNQDVVKAPAVYQQALAGAPRPYLLFFGGGIRPSDREYSGGVRLALSRYVLEKSLPDVKNGGDSSMYSQATFCICPYGHGWGSRLTHSMVGACIPVIIQDHVHVILSDVLDYPSFAVRLSKADIPKLMTILRGITVEQIQAYRAAMSLVWRQFSWQEEAFNGTINSLKRKAYNLKAYHYK